jgi:hypothetical protein
MSDFVDPYLPSDFSLPQLIDSEYFNDYVQGYGTALGDFNLGLVRSMQGDIRSVSTDCYYKAKVSSKSMAEMFNVENYKQYSFAGAFAQL